MCVVVWSGGPENCQQSALASVLSEVPHSLFWSIHHMKKVKAPSSKARGKPPGAQIFYTSEYLPPDTHTLSVKKPPNKTSLPTFELNSVLSQLYSSQPLHHKFTRQFHPALHSTSGYIPSWDLTSRCQLPSALTLPTG